MFIEKVESNNLDTVVVGDANAKPLDIALDRISIDLEPVQVLENLFTGAERILCSVKQTEINDGLGVMTLLIEQF